MFATNDEEIIEGVNKIFNKNHSMFRIKTSNKTFNGEYVYTIIMDSTNRYVDINLSGYIIPNSETFYISPRDFNILDQVKNYIVKNAKTEQEKGIICFGLDDD